MKCLTKNKNNNKVKSVKVYCNDCKHEFSMNTVNIEETTVDISGQVLKLVYFTCPKCNKIYRVSLEDKRCEELKEDLEETKLRIRKNYGRISQKFLDTLNVMINKKHERLEIHMAKLNERFPGTFTYVVSENNHKEKEKFIKYLP